MKNTDASSVAGRVSASSEIAARQPSLVNSAATKPSRLWLWFLAAFLVQAAAWTAWFVIASQHKVQEVPLASAR